MTKAKQDVSAEQAFIKLKELLEQQIKAARADDLASVNRIADECTKIAFEIGHTAALKGPDGKHVQQLKELYSQLICILADKLAVAEQQLRSVQQGQKLLGIYRP